MSEGTPKIYSAMAKVQEELEAIGKNQKGYGYNFRGIDDVLNALHPLFKKHKIVTARRDVESQREVRLVVKEKKKIVKGEQVIDIDKKEFVEVLMQAKYAFISLEDGSEIVTEGFGEGQDTSGGDKASSMATSNAYKYVIFEFFNIATQEQKDSDQVTAEKNKKSSFAKKEEKKEEPKKTTRGAKKKEDKEEKAETPKEETPKEEKKSERGSFRIRRS